MGESQLASQLNAQESQFMRATGNIVRDRALYHRVYPADPRPKEVI